MHIISAIKNTFYKLIFGKKYITVKFDDDDRPREEFKSVKPQPIEENEINSDKLYELHEHERSLYLTHLSENICTAKIASAFNRGYKSTRIKLDMIALEGDLCGVREAILKNLLVSRVTFKKIKDNTYAILHFIMDNEGNYIQGER